MKPADLSPITTHSLLGSDPSGVTIEKPGKDGKYKAFSDDSDKDQPIATLTVKDWVLTDLEIEEGYEESVGSIASVLIRAACKDADQKNKVLVIHPNALPGHRIARFMELFGFMRTKNEYMERRPGGALPLSAML